MGLLDRLWTAIGESMFGNAGGQVAASTEQHVRRNAQTNAVVVWLLGKTGAGKTAIVAALTGDPRAKVGEGFEPCTRTAAFYEVPPEAPLLRFLDTRGLGEVNYDPAHDISWCEEQSHLLLAVMQVSDPVQDTVLRPLKHARRHDPDWPVVVAQTGLHRLYPNGMAHPIPYPYTGGPEDEMQAGLPHALRQALAYQRKLFEGLRGPRPRFVPIDFTVPEDGFPPHDFGLEMLWRVLEEVGPNAFEALHLARAAAESDQIRARARPLIYGYGAAAAGAGAVPVPIVGVGGLAGVIAVTLRALAIRYDVAWTPRTFAQFSGAVGGGALAWWTLRYGLRELIKLIPILGTVVAGAFNAAAAFAITVAIGEAACVWLAYRRRGLAAPNDEVRRAFAEGLAAGLRQAKSRTARMKIGKTLRAYWPEMLLVLAVGLPWLSLVALGIAWLWQGGHVWAWAISAAVLGVLAWPLSKLVRGRANAEARLALGDIAEPCRSWNAVERDAWSEVLTIADATPPFSFTELEPLIARARETVEAVAHWFHPDAHSAWAQFSLPEVLLLAERLCRDVRREALRHIPGVRTLRLSQLLWVQRQTEQYGAAAQTGWRLGFGIWRLARAVLNPLQAAGQETSGFILERTASVLSYRLRAYATRMLVLEIGRAAIDLYSGRLALSEDEVRAARERDAAEEPIPPPPVRLVLIGQTNAGKSSLVNALAQETRCAVGPMPTTSRAVEYHLELEGRPTVSLVDMPGLGECTAQELLAQAGRADLIVWVASATQPARGPDRQRLDDFRAWAKAQLVRRPPPVLLALTHVDELRPAKEWKPPYDVIAPAGPKARTIRAAMDAAGCALDFPADAIVPVAMPPGREFYNLDALWARIAIELDEAKLVQLDRLRVGRQGLDLRELADQLGHAGRVIIKGIVKA